MSKNYTPEMTLEEARAILGNRSEQDLQLIVDSLRRIDLSDPACEGDFLRLEAAEVLLDEIRFADEFSLAS